MLISLVKRDDSICGAVGGLLRLNPRIFHQKLRIFFKLYLFIIIIIIIIIFKSSSDQLMAQEHVSYYRENKLSIITLL